MARAGHLGVGVAQINKENTGQPAKFEFQMINLFFSFSVSTSPEIHTKIITIIT